MKAKSLKLCIVYLAVSLSLIHCTNKKVDETSESQKLLDLEKEAITKEFQNDTFFLSSIMDSTFIEISPKRLKNKHEVLKTIWDDNVQNSEAQIVRDSFRLNDPVVHVYDNAAVVTFVMETFNKKRDSAFTRRTRFYDVWVKRGKQWKAISWQGSAVE